MGYLTPVSLSLWLCPRFELSDHIDSIDNNLENLQGILNSQTFTFDPSPLMEVSLVVIHLFYSVSLKLLVHACTN